MSSTTGPPPPDPEGFTPARRRKIHLAQAFCKKLYGYIYDVTTGRLNEVKAATKAGKAKAT